MLSDEEMVRIRAEEVFRQEIREKLEFEKPTASLGEKVWKLLNSSFALWFLSSVILAFLTWAFSEYQHNRSEEKAKADLRKRINTEISFRIENGIIQNNVDAQRVKLGEKFTRYAVLGTEYNYLNNYVYDRDVSPPEQIDYSIYQEYKNRRFRALLHELKNVTTRDNIKNLQDVERDFMKFESAVDSAHLEVERSKTQNVATSKDLENALTFLSRLQENPIWKNSD